MITNFSIQSIGEFVKHTSVKNKKNLDIEVYSVTNKNGFTSSVEFFNKEVFSKDTSTYKIVKEGGFAYNPSRINVGSIDYLQRKESVLVSPLYVCFETNEQLDNEYLLRFLRSPWGKSQIISKAEGAVRANLKYSILERIKIPIPLLDNSPDLEAQRKIAYVLKKVEILILSRKTSIDKLNSLYKSIFKQMFGDPILNEKNWDTALCKEVIPKIASGTSYGGYEKDKLDFGELGVLKISAVTQGIFNSDEFKVVKKSEIKKQLLFVKKGNLLFSRANTRELVAACAIVDQDYDNLFLPDKLWRLDINQELATPQFVNHLLKNEKYRSTVTGLASGGHKSMLNISMKKFHGLTMISPPLTVQNKFSSIVDRLDKLRDKYQINLNEIETLFGALSQKAFKGELDLSKIELPIQEELNPKSEFIKAESSTPVTVDLPTAIKADNRAQPTFTDNKIRPLINVTKGESNQEQENIDQELTLSKNYFENWQENQKNVFNSEYPMSDPIARRDIVLNGFNDFISKCAGKELKLEVFWQELNLGVLDLMDEGDSPIGTSDYEFVKHRVYELIVSKIIIQEFDEAENKMVLRVANEVN